MSLLAFHVRPHFASIFLEILGGKVIKRIFQKPTKPKQISYSQIKKHLLDNSLTNLPFFYDLDALHFGCMCWPSCIVSSVFIPNSEAAM